MENTKNTNGHNGVGNTNSTPRRRRWCFTLCNYTEEEVAQLKNTLDTKNTRYIFGYEIAESGTPHLQGYMEYKNPVKLETLKKWNKRIHWEQARGDREANLRYCKKEGNYVSTFHTDDMTERLKNRFKDMTLYKWQEDLIKILEGDPDDRTVYWIYDMVGNIGKSWFCKYIFLHYGCVIGDGKKNDVFNQIKTDLDENNIPRIVILDIPRHNKEFTNYGMLEQIKNGLIYSGKYEGGKLAFESPHLFIFSNSLPDYEKFSNDRWKVCEITNKDEHIKWFNKIHKT